MKLTRIELTDFRNVAQAALQMEGQRQFLWGANGQGKTNLLEAVGLAQGLRSFRTHMKAPMVRLGAPQATVRSVWQHEHRGETTLGVTLSKERRQVLLDGKTVKSAQEVLGVFPVVALTLADRILIYGGPGAKREEIDGLICQMHPPYWGTLGAYDEALKQRNRLLTDPGHSDAERQAWEAQMEKTASVMIRARQKMVEHLQERLEGAFHGFAPQSERPRITYQPQTPAEELVKAWRENLADEKRRGMTLCGPHRDTLELWLGEEKAEEYASEGQKFSLVLGLKLAGLKLLEEKLGIAPVVVADDLLLELDAKRQEKFWQSVGDWQVIASGTQKPPALWQMWEVTEGKFALVEGK